MGFVAGAGWVPDFAGTTGFTGAATFAGASEDGSKVFVDSAEKLIAAFNEEYPDITVEFVNYSPQESWNQLSLAIQGGTASTDGLWNGPAPTPNTGGDTLTGLGNRRRLMRDLEDGLTSGEPAMTDDCVPHVLADGIIAPPAPQRELLVIHPLELRFAFEQTLFGDRNQHVAINQSIQQRQIINQRDFAHDLIGVEARILRAIDEETKHALEIQRMARRRGGRVLGMARRLGGRELGCGVEGAVELAHLRGFQGWAGEALGRLGFGADPLPRRDAGSAAA